MSHTGSPFVLVVDDEPDKIRNEARVGLRDRVHSEVTHPRDVQLDQLSRADLVLVDFVLNEWVERSSVCLAMQPANGLALTIVLREHLDASDKNRLTAFALHSAHLSEVRGRLAHGSSEHVIARLNNIEWAFSKSDPQRWDRVVALATAMQSLPRKWPSSNPEGSEEAAAEMLGLKADAAWFERAWRSSRSCQPPIHELSDGAHGGLFVRWLLHQILPYPTFLIGPEWVAARLRVTSASLDAAIAEGGSFAAGLKTAEYTGTLAGFLGQRWWRAGLEHWLWTITEGKSSNISDLHGALSKLTSKPLEVLAAEQSVVALGRDFRPTGAVIAASEAVRLRPDHWPSFADGAWASVSDARSDSFLSALVDPLDAARLDDGTASAATKTP
jgi:hypothetical protein